MKVQTSFSDADSKQMGLGMPHISVVIPVYKADSCLEELYLRLVVSLEKIPHDFEIIFVEDCGGDLSWSVIVDLAHRDSRVRGIQFSRNFGQHYAITAGLDYAQGEWVVVMDCDLQDQPEEVLKLYAEAMRGYDIVVGRRYERKDNALKKVGSKLFYRAFDYLADQKSDATIANFGIYSRRVIGCVNKIREQNRFFPLAVRWVGFNISEVNVDHSPRMTGKSSYNFRKLLNLAIDSIVSQSNKPLRLSIKAGFLLSLSSFLYAAYLASRYFFWGMLIAGWTSVMVSMYFIAGLLLANMGILGLYIGKIFDETKGRPLYIVREEVGFSSRNSQHDVSINR